MPYTRSTYILVHQGKTLLSLDASLTPPFMVGEDVELHEDIVGESLGCFLVEKVSRAVPYCTVPGTGPIAMAGQEVTVHLRRRLPVEEADHGHDPIVIL